MVCLCFLFLLGKGGGPDLRLTRLSRYGSLGRRFIMSLSAASYASEMAGTCFAGVSESERESVGVIVGVVGGARTHTHSGDRRQRRSAVVVVK